MDVCFLRDSKEMQWALTNGGITDLGVLFILLDVYIIKDMSILIQNILKMISKVRS